MVPSGTTTALGSATPAGMSAQQQAGIVSGGSIGSAGSSNCRLFLAGDVMLGRGIDQVLPHPVQNPRLYESYCKSATQYVDLTIARHGLATAPKHSLVGVWGDAIEVMHHLGCDAGVVNLETAITDREEPWNGKGIHYKMSAGNAGSLVELGRAVAGGRRGAGNLVCTLANNHVMDWGHDGLGDTFESLGRLGVKHAGAGANLGQAQEPAIVELAEGVLMAVISVGMASSGIPTEWGASSGRPGVNLGSLERVDLDQLTKQISALKQRYSNCKLVTLVSIHWGANWDFTVYPGERQFARALVSAGADIVHGHSSHHIKGIEVYQGKLIMYGCGDLINDYEGIDSLNTARYLGNVGLMYFVDVDPSSGALAGLSMVPTTVENLQIKVIREEKILKHLLNVVNREFLSFSVSMWIESYQGTLRLNRAG